MQLVALSLVHCIELTEAQLIVAFDLLVRRNALRLTLFAVSDGCDEAGLEVASF